MSQENVEFMKVAFELWNGGDRDATRELLDPDATLRMPQGWPEPGPFAGRDAVVRQWDRLREAWDADALEPIEDLIDAGDRVVARITWRGAGHGPALNMELTGVYTVRNGRLLA